MPSLIARERSFLLLIDLQAKLVPAIAEAEPMLANARRLKDAAALLEVPTLLIEQNPEALGSTVPDLAGGDAIAKMEFDLTQREDIVARIPEGADVILVGCEAHICILQTGLSLKARGHRVHVVRDAIGSRRAANREAAVARLLAHEVDVVTTEMVIFEWLGSAKHPRFREVVRLIK